MSEFAKRLQNDLRQVDGEAEVFIHGGEFHQNVRGCQVGERFTDILVISRKLTREEVREAVRRSGGNPTHSSLYRSRQAFLRSRQFTLDQGALGLGGTVAFTTKQCLNDLEGGVIRPTVWVREHDEAREGHTFSASLCGRTVRLSGHGFQPTKELADYIRENWTALLGSSRFRWQATKSDAAKNNPDAVPVPAFVQLNE